MLLIFSNNTVVPYFKYIIYLYSSTLHLIQTNNPNKSGYNRHYAHLAASAP